MKRLPIALAVAAFALMGATGAYAANVKINGSTVNQSVNATNNSNSASGKEAVAKQSIGRISDAEITGSTVNQNVSAANNSNSASGAGSVACQDIGVIGTSGGAQSGGGGGSLLGGLLGSAKSNGRGC
jgi:hypothetical protein